MKTKASPTPPASHVAAEGALQAHPRRHMGHKAHPKTLHDQPPSYSEEVWMVLNAEGGGGRCGAGSSGRPVGEPDRPPFIFFCLGKRTDQGCSTWSLPGRPVSEPDRPSLDINLSPPWPRLGIEAVAHTHHRSVSNCSPAYNTSPDQEKGLPRTTKRRKDSWRGCCCNQLAARKGLVKR